MGTKFYILGKQVKSSSQCGKYIVVPVWRLALAVAAPNMWLCLQLRHLLCILGFQVAKKELQEGAAE